MENKVPVFTIEEHNEAFYIWNYCIKECIISPKNNKLFHVDEHSDMIVPRYDSSVKDLNGHLDSILKFTRQQVGISNFIYPAIYLDIFDSIYWIKQQHNKKSTLVRMFVTSYQGDGMKLIGGKSTNAVIKLAIENSDIRFFNFFLKTIDRIPNNSKGILDIDLDYFSCSGDPNELEKIMIEITSREYHRLKQNIYHRIYYQSIKAKVDEIEGKYYLIFNDYKQKYFATFPATLKVTTEVIGTRIDYFIEVLKEKKFKPTLITICRSRHTGFTPADQWMLIEERLLAGLASIFSLDMKILSL